VEVIPIQKVNEASERLLKQDVKDRFVIDMSSLGYNGGRSFQSALPVLVSSL
jgi:hypothetical protein